MGILSIPTGCIPWFSNLLPLSDNYLEHANLHLILACSGPKWPLLWAQVGQLGAQLDPEKYKNLVQISFGGLQASTIRLARATYPM